MAATGPLLRSTDPESQRVNMTCMTTWFDLRLDSVRAISISIMLGSLNIGATIPNAFEDRGLVVALVYVVAVCRNVFVRRKG